MTLLAGLDIGGTKCAVCIGQVEAHGVTVLVKQRFETPRTSGETLAQLAEGLAELERRLGLKAEAIGLSCGGPLDSRRGLILSPPNLPGWDAVDVVSPLQSRFRRPIALQNDANACALAEWRWGAGRGCASMVFLTFGTGMGAGLILDGRLYSGISDLAGEVGHLRLAEDGPWGYGKAGSFEGFCSGGGIARLAQSLAVVALQRESPPAFCPDWSHLAQISAQSVGAAAAAGDPLALEIWRQVGHRLGCGLALLVDLLNPERIVIGSIYGRQQPYLEAAMRAALQAEALPQAVAACQILPAALGEAIGDVASLSVAYQLVAPATSSTVTPTVQCHP